MAMKYEYQVVHRGVCNNLDILRQDIQTISGVCKAMYGIDDV